MDVGYDDDDDDFGAQFFEDSDGPEAMDADKNAAATPSDEQILNDFLKKNQVKRARKRHVIPQPKLRDVELCGPNGLLQLKRIFDSYIPRHKDPFDELIVTMNKIEYWAHRLYPKFTFEDFTNRVESLSDKKMIKTTMTKIRLDMPLTDDNFVANKENKETKHTHVNDNDGDNDNDNDNQHCTYAPQTDMDLFEFATDVIQDPVPSTSQISVPSSGFPVRHEAAKLSQEQLQRIEENKRRAQRLRAEREKLSMNRLADTNPLVMEAKSPIQDEAAANDDASQTSELNSRNAADLEGQQNGEFTSDILMDDNEALDLIFSSVR